MTRQMKRNFAVERGLSLKQRKEHFSQSPEGIQTTVWKTGFQVGGQRVSMQQGGINARHRL